MASITVRITADLRGNRFDSLCRRGHLCLAHARALGLAVMAIAVLTGSEAHAADWRVTPRGAVDEAYNDNVNAAPKGQEQSDFITSLSPGIGIHGAGRRVNLDLDYDPQVLIFAKDPNRNDVRQRLLGKGRAEILRELLFFDASASIDQSIINPQAGVAGTNLTASQNFRTIQTYNAGPTLRNHFGPYATSELSYRFSAVNVDSEQVSNTTTNDVTATLRSGEYFGRLGWTLKYDESRTNRTGSQAAFGGTSSNHRLGKGDFQYALFPRLSLLAGAGYEDIEDSTLAENLVGPTWDAGFLYRPSRTLSLRFTYGRRFQKPSTNVDLTYKISPHTRLIASYAETVQTSQGLLARNTSQIAISPSGQFINPQTGLPYRPGDQVLGLNSGAFRQKRLSTLFSSVRGRNTYNVEFFNENRDSGLVNQTEKSIGGQVGWNRSLTRATDFNTELLYSRIDFGDSQGRTDNRYSLNMGLTYRMSRSLVGRLSFERTDRSSNVSGNNVTEDVILLGIRMQL